MKRIAIYGAGGQGRIFFEVLQRDGVNVDLFIDQFIDIKELSGVPVLRLADVTEKHATTVYISIASDERTGVNLQEILHQDGFCEVIDFLAAINTHPDILTRFFEISSLWMRPDPAAMLNRTELEKVEALLSDDTSRACLQRLINFRQSMTPETYPMPDGQIEYFPSDINLFSGIDRLRFADCGAYNGDTILNILRLDIPIEYVASFEPDPANLSNLVGVIERLSVNNTDTRFFAFNMGIWSRPDILQFNCNGGSSSSINTDANTDGHDVMSVPVTSLDTALYGAAPNFIKMDVEGSEGEALKGCHRLITTYRPVLAICVYHNPHDLWEVPLFIHNNYPWYEMYLRIHSHMGTSTVLYCVPRHNRA